MADNHSGRISKSVNRDCERYLRGELSLAELEGTADAALGALEGDASPGLKGALGQFVVSLEHIRFMFVEGDQRLEVYRAIEALRSAFE